MKTVIIGGVAAGMSAASKLKRLDKNNEIFVFEKGNVLSYGACGMPYYISGEITNAKKLIARTKKDFEDKGITVFTKHEVIKLNELDKQILVRDLISEKDILVNYDNLVIATGASPIKLQIPGKDLTNIFSLSEYEDALKIKEYINNGVKDIVIVGAGFIGVELVEAFNTLGLHITLIEYNDQILNLFDKDITDYLEDHLKENQINVRTKETVLEYKIENGVTYVLTDKGKYKADMIIESVGVRPNTKFTSNTSIKLAKNGAIIVDENMMTSVKDIYSGGDCSLIFNKALNQNTYIPMGHNANKQGRIIAQSIMNEENNFEGVLGTTVIKVINMEAAKTGLTEKDAIKIGASYRTVTAKGKNHAGYYPNATMTTVKVIYDPLNYKILGAEIVGYKDSAIRIDIFAVAIHAGLTTKQLGFIDLAYAPPFASVWDITQVAANIAK
ncbi:CoA-disulfide reductase [Candidatus Izimaplasma sp. ZiA1]|uniref:CoA-disulfide reductase n=1 Tax=Candidatus Izimoplasma sp. ZiA1 TaxID=2024899 RepID=UPI00143BDB49